MTRDTSCQSVTCQYTLMTCHYTITEKGILRLNLLDGSQEFIPMDKDELARYYERLSAMPGTGH